MSHNWTSRSIHSQDPVAGIKRGLEPCLSRPAQSFQVGSSALALQRPVARHVAIAAANALMQVTRVGLTLLGIAKKGGKCAVGLHQYRRARLLAVQPTSQDASSSNSVVLISPGC
jgi:hypothetical protein